jgi:hypothetical protein
MISIENRRWRRSLMTPRLEAEPLPVLWLTFSCEGGCVPPVPRGLPSVIVYSDGRFVVSSARRQPDDRLVLSVRQGELSPPDNDRLAGLIAATDLSNADGPNVIPLPDGAHVSDGGTTYFTLRTSDRTVTRGVAFLGYPDFDSAAPRAPYAGLQAWLTQLANRPDLQTVNRWLMLAPDDVGAMGNLNWTTIEGSERCTLFDDPDRALTAGSDGTWKFPHGATLLRPALLNETDCAAVAAWQAAPSSTPGQ